MIKNREVVGWLFRGSWALYVLILIFFQIKCDGITLHLLNIVFQLIFLIGWDGSQTLYLQLCRSGGARKSLKNKQTKIVIVH